MAGVEGEGKGRKQRAKRVSVRERDPSSQLSRGSFDLFPPFLWPATQARHRQPTELLVQFSSALRHRGNRVTISPHRLWAFQDQLTVVWRTKYSGVSTLILLCYYQTTCISPRPLRSSSVWMTRPQAPWVPPSPWLERKKSVIDTFQK